MKVLIEIPEDHKRVIDNLVVDGKGYLLPQEVETRLAKAVKIGTVIPDNATDGDVVEKLFGKDIYCTLIRMMYSSCCEKLKKWWNAPYRREGE